MPDPLFDSRTSRFNLPLLFAGQAQKEGFVNEALARIDAILHCAIESELVSPPPSPPEGQSWLVGSSALGEWAGKSGQIASRQSGNWLFISPRNGMKILNLSTAREMRYLDGWQTLSPPPAPSGGATIDAEARDAIGALIAILQQAGILA